MMIQVKTVIQSWLCPNFKQQLNQVILFPGIVNLKACKTYKNKFEQGMINEFTLEAVDLGDLEKLRIGHDNSGENNQW